MERRRKPASRLLLLIVLIGVLLATAGCSSERKSSRLSGFAAPPRPALTPLMDMGENTLFNAYWYPEPFLGGYITMVIQGDGAIASWEESSRGQRNSRRGRLLAHELDQIKLLLSELQTPKDKVPTDNAITILWTTTDDTMKTSVCAARLCPFDLHRIFWLAQAAAVREDETILNLVDAPFRDEVFHWYFASRQARGGTSANYHITWYADSSNYRWLSISDSEVDVGETEDKFSFGFSFPLARLEANVSNDLEECFNSIPFTEEFANDLETVKVSSWIDNEPVLKSTSKSEPPVCMQDFLTAIEKMLDESQSDVGIDITPFR